VISSIQSRFARSGTLRAILLIPLSLALVGAIGTVGAFAGWFSAVGVSRLAETIESKISTQEGVSSHDSPTTEAPIEVPLFDDWPSDKPALVLAISGEMLGYMRPCGCSEGMSGGLARRAGLLEFLTKEKGWETVALDFGDLVKAEFPWDEARYHYTIESLKTLGYKVVGIGTHDLSVKAMSVAGEALNSDPLKLLAANLKSQNEDFNIVLGDIIVPMHTFEAGGVKLAVASVISESQKEEIRDQSVEVSPIAETVPTVLQKMTEAGAGLKVLFAHMPKSEAEELAKTYPGFDLIITKSDLDHPTKDDATMVGNTMVTWLGKKGMELGIIGYWPGASPKLRFEPVLIDPRFKEGEALQEIYTSFVQYLADKEYLAKLPQLDHPSGTRYIGSSRCATCHPKAFEKWKSTKHSHALQTLTDAKPEGQDYNPECVKCHVVGHGFNSGFVTPDKTPDMGGVGCENCHGPGEKHANAPTDEAGKAMMRVSKNEADCIKCHDSENSVHFNFKTYWPRIEHPWKN
jgi:nitrate/TMAO reductase-like tetraheme cytochrome c subunit